ncbi:MAG: response regulator [Chloroflexota bacterium]
MSVFVDMMAIISRFLRPPIFNDPETTRTASQLHYVILSGVLIAGGITPLSYFLNSDLQRGTIWITASSALLLATLYFLLRKGNVRTVSMSIILIGYCAVTTSLLVNEEGIRDSASTIFPLLLILSSVFLGSKETLGFGILSLAVIISIWFVEYIGWLETDFEDPPSDSFLVLLTGISFATLFLRTTVNRIVEGASKIRDQAAELEVNNSELQQAQQVLQSQTTELSRLNVELVAEISERERTEAVLRQRQKQEGIALLAGGVAHDFNNLLTAMIAQSTLALHKLEPTHRAYQNIVKAVNAAERGADLTRQLLAYAGRSSFQIEPFNLNELIRENRGLLESLTQHSQKMEFKLVDPLSLIEADRGQIQQVLMNLVLNASDAIYHDQGLIIIATEAKVFDPKELSGNQLVSLTGDIPPAGQYISLSVKDNGSGMDTATLEKIVDPFFTTKESGHGLGLSAISGIVRALGGSLHVTSQVGIGSTFFVHLLASTQQSTLQHEMAIHSPLDDHFGTILLVDDEEFILDSTAEILQSEGYETLTARSGLEGVKLFQQHCLTIDAVLLDVHMPGMNGVDAYLQMVKIMPDVPIIFSSGFATVNLPHRLSTTNTYQILPKPYEITALLDMVNKVIRSA